MKVTFYRIPLLYSILNFFKCGQPWLTITFLLAFNITWSAQAQSKEWDQTYGGVITTNNNRTYGSSYLHTVVTTNYGYLLGGRSNSSVGNDKTQGRQGSYDYWLVNTDPKGNKIWDKRYGGTGEEDLQAIVNTADGGYLLGGTSASDLGGDISHASKGGQDYWLIKIDADGTKLWDQRFGGSGNDVLKTLVATPGGGFILGGYSNSGLSGDKSQPSRGGQDYWIIRIDEYGNKLWDRRYGGSEDDVFKSLVVTLDGGFLLAGSSNSGVGSDKSEPVWGGFQFDYWVVKINGAGVKQWDKRLGGNSSDDLEALVVTSDGSYLLGGLSYSFPEGDKTDTQGWFEVGIGEYWLVKMDGNGNKLWDKALNGTSHVVSSLIPTPDGGFIAGGGNPTEENSEEDDYWVTKVNSTGNTVWEKYVAGPGRDYLRSILTTEAGEIILGGWSNSGMGNDKSGVKKGLNDYWLVKLQEVDCIPVITYGCDDVNIIQSFSFNSLFNDDSGCDGQGNGYSSYAPSGNYTTMVIRDQTYTITVQPSLTGDFEQGFGVWIDYNNDNDFDDPAEFVFSSPIVFEQYSGTVVIPASATPGQHRLRVRSHFANVVTSEQSCTEFDYGETEDYIITIANPSIYAAWNKRFGGSKRDSYTDIIRTTDGGYLIGGYTDSEDNGDKTQPSRGGIDYWIVKIDAEGNKQWDRRYGGPGNDYLNRLIATLDGGYLLGGSSESGIGGDKTQNNRGDRDYWLVKINSSGVKLWDKRYGGTGYDELSKITQLITGEYFVAGYSSSAASGDKSQGSQGGRDYWVLKLNAAGNALWDRRYGGNLNDNLENFVLTNDGGYLLGGASASGLSGDRSQLSRGGEDYWVVRLDANGNKIWDRRYGGSDKDHMFSMGRLSNGSFYLGGYSISDSGGDKTQPGQGGRDFWLVVINSAGEKLWDRRFGGNLDDELRSIIRTSDGGYLLGGKSDSPVSGNKSQNSRGSTDYWIVKISGNGTRQWDQRFGGVGIEELRNMVVTPDGGYLLGGRSESGISGDKSQPSQGGQDYWLVKVALSGMDASSVVQVEEDTEPFTANREKIVVNPAAKEITELKLDVRPNPFSEKLQVHFTLPQSELVSLKVYNSQGQEVRTLFQGQADAGKVYE
ncbi:MAG: GEVED domain-containing protein, partial [Bacteroidota bacterium]|nr:GEVED domain-containing protein [Bacteroidota bacterium]